LPLSDLISNWNRPDHLTIEICRETKSSEKYTVRERKEKKERKKWGR
jgi:hypothetical protein